MRLAGACCAPAAVGRSAEVGLAAGVADGIDRMGLPSVTSCVEQTQAAFRRAFPDPEAVLIPQSLGLSLDLLPEALVRRDRRLDVAGALLVGLAGVGVVL